MKAREEIMIAPIMKDTMKRVLPVLIPDESASQMLDNTLEFWEMNGFPLPLVGMVYYCPNLGKDKIQTTHGAIYTVITQQFGRRKRLRFIEQERFKTFALCFD